MRPRFAPLFFAVCLAGCTADSGKPGADGCAEGPDLCDLQDNDCDGQIDEDQPSTRLWPDADADGFGDASDPGTDTCGTLLGSVPNAEDCDDDDPDVHPEAWDGCDLQDTDCDGIDDDDDPPFVLWPDDDGDGQGDLEAPGELSCVWSSAHATNNLDCDDTDLHVYAGAEEVCDEVDNDCDGAVDEDDVCGGVLR